MAEVAEPAELNEVGSPSSRRLLAHRGGLAQVVVVLNELTFLAALAFLQAVAELNEVGSPSSRHSPSRRWPSTSWRSSLARVAMAEPAEPWPW